MTEEIDADPEVLLANACSLGLEGIIGKHRDRPYRSGRYGDWVKVKCVQSDTFAIIGYEPSTALPGAVASLLLAAEVQGGYRYVGNVGTGFKHDEARRLKRLLDKIKTKVPVDRVPGKNVVMTRPRYRAEFEYRARTTDGKLRNPSYKGLRDKDDSADVYKVDGKRLIASVTTYTGMPTAIAVATITEQSLTRKVRRTLRSFNSYVILRNPTPCRSSVDQTEVAVAGNIVTPLVSVAPLR